MCGKVSIFALQPRTSFNADQSTEFIKGIFNVVFAKRRETKMQYF